MIVMPHIPASDTTGTDCLPITQAQAHKNAAPPDNGERFLN
jgi:hypothetical protein